MLYFFINSTNGFLSSSLGNNCGLYMNFDESNSIIIISKNEYSEYNLIKL